MAVGQSGEQFVDLLPEGVLLAVARSVDPPDLTRVVAFGKRAEHRQDGRRADACADQGDRIVVVAQHEIPAGCGRVDRVAGLDVLLKKPAASPARLELDADPVSVVGPDRRQRVRAHNRRVVGPVGPKPKREVLAGGGSRRRVRTGWPQPEGDDRAALAVHRGHGQRREPLPGGRRTSVCTMLGLLQQLAKRALPALAERRDPQRPLQRPP